MSGDGRLVVVGSGIQLGRDLPPRARSHVETADIVFALADPFTMAWLEGLRPDVRHLGVHYGPGKDRRQSYQEMEDALLAEVHAGRTVCALFYGHPGVFADVPHVAIRKVRECGLQAVMEPGISAEACLYADLGFDPGRVGVQSWEATQFLISRRAFDPSSLLILWQIALCGDLTCTREDTTAQRLQLLVDKLCTRYPPAAEIILYEAAWLPIQSHRADRMPLSELPGARFEEYTTLVIPPAESWQEDEAVLSALRAIGGDTPMTT